MPAARAQRLAYRTGALRIGTQIYIALGQIPCGGAAKSPLCPPRSPPRGTSVPGRKPASHAKTRQARAGAPAGPGVERRNGLAGLVPSAGRVVAAGAGTPVGGSRRLAARA